MRFRRSGKNKLDANLNRSVSGVFTVTHIQIHAELQKHGQLHTYTFRSRNKILTGFIHTYCWRNMYAWTKLSISRPMAYYKLIYMCAQWTFWHLMNWLKRNLMWWDLVNEVYMEICFGSLFFRHGFSILHYMVLDKISLIVIMWHTFSMAESYRESFKLPRCRKR